MTSISVLTTEIGDFVGEQDEMEKPAKQWQVAAIQKDIHDLNTKMDQLLQASNSYVTQQDLEDHSKESNKYITNQVALIRAKYDPIYKLFWALITAVAIESAVLVLQIVSSK